MTVALRISVLALVLSASSVAWAQDGSAEPTPAQVRVAAEAFDKGREAYKAGEFVEAAEQFEKADNNAPSAAAIELAARSRDKAGELDRAATLASLALRRHPDDPNLLRLAGDLAKRASSSLFELTAICDKPCDLTVGGKLVHGTPDTQRILYVAPGPLTVRAGWSDDRSDSKQIQAEVGGKGEVSFTAPSAPAGPSLANVTAPGASEPRAPNLAQDSGSAKESRGWSPAVFYVGAGLTAVLGGITVWSGLDTVNNPGADRVKEECGALMQREDCELYKEGLSKQRRTNVLIGVTAGVGVATVLIGVLATNFRGTKTDPATTAKRLKPSLNVAPYAWRDGGGLQAVGRF